MAGRAGACAGGAAMALLAELQASLRPTPSSSTAARANVSPAGARVLVLDFSARSRWQRWCVRETAVAELPKIVYPGQVSGGAAQDRRPRGPARVRSDPRRGCARWRRRAALSPGDSRRRACERCAAQPLSPGPARLRGKSSKTSQPACRGRLARPRSRFVHHVARGQEVSVCALSATLTVRGCADRFEY